MAKASSVRRATINEMKPVASIRYQVIDTTGTPFGDDATAAERSAFANYNQLVERVVDAFGDEITASKWLSAPSADFDQKSPLQIAREHNYELAPLEPILIRIEHGVYF